MKNFLCRNANKCEASGSVVDGKLILSFPNANDPVLWQMDLTSAKSSALEVVTNKDPKYFALVLKTPKGEALEVAKFNLREDAVQGLMVASGALRSAHGKIRHGVDGGECANPALYAHKEAKPWKWVRRIFGIIIVVFLVLFFVTIAFMPPPNGSGQPGTSASALSPTAPVLGEAISADAFLEGL